MLTWHPYEPHFIRRTDGRKPRHCLALHHHLGWTVGIGAAHGSGSGVRGDTAGTTRSLRSTS